eukprot:Hpha_TRINITY_DN12529_c0_g1::TRINITY_DN12529_c0_g1_i2::g.50984::m.50984/K17261/CAP1_2, SRV2; adenylyl cyclase-associated protein
MPPKFPTGEAKCALEGKKWEVEFQTGTRQESKELTIEADKSQTVYIYGCQFTYLQIKGKVNAIAAVKCKRLQISFEDVVGQVEITDCESCEAQVTGKLPSIAIDKSDGFMLYLSRDSVDVDITSCASTNMNVTVAGKTDEDDPTELAIPEQFISKIKGNKIDTAATEHCD